MTLSDTPVRPIAVRPREAARLLSISRSHLYELLAAGEIASRRLGGARLIEVLELERYVAALPVVTEVTRGHETAA